MPSAGIQSRAMIFHIGNNAADPEQAIADIRGHVAGAADLPQNTAQALGFLARRLRSAGGRLLAKDQVGYLVEFRLDLFENVGCAVDDGFENADEYPERSRAVGVFVRKPLSHVVESFQIFEADRHQYLRRQKKSERRPSDSVALSEKGGHAEIQCAVFDMQAARCFNFDKLVPTGNI